MDFIPLRNWIEYDDKPLVIAGPCSAETEEQVLATARSIVSIPNVKVFRSGIWKPRTRPGGFEGVGKIGLEWLKKVKTEIGLLTTVEVAKPEHVNEAVEAGIDILWIGARTVVNPFSVQELAEAMAGMDIPLLIKNPVNPDIKLWIGAIERFFKTGHHRIAAVHRGFSQIERSGFRYPPIWEIPIELMRLLPGLPVLCDPSHISGSAAMIRSVSQQALDLEMQGLMIETHIDPAHALTDARQQLSPSMLEEVLNSLVIRQSGVSFEVERNLELLRHEIDKIDDQMLNLLAKRMEISEEMGKYKYDHNITILQIRRWKELFADRISKGEERNLNLEFLASLLRLVHEESIRIQTNVMKQSDIEENKSN